MKKIIVSFFSCMLILIILYSFIRLETNKNDETINLELNASKEASYAISTSNYLATNAGKEILEQGGNAVDAAIAISYALGVAQPYGSGIGGGGAMLIYNPSDNTYKFYNYYASAPNSSSAKRNSIGVPGLVAGLNKVHSDYGSIDMAKLIEPSYQLAKNGIEVYDELELMISTYSNYLIQNKNYIKDGKLLVKGDKLYQPELANTLRTLQEEGTNSFYNGSLAKNIANNTYLTLEDLKSYNVNEYEPVRGVFEGYEVISAPSPLGGITLIQMLKMFSLTNIPNPQNNPSKYLETLNAVSSIAIADRVQTIADPKYYKENQNHLTNTEYVKNLLKNNYMEYEDDEESETTTAFSVIDKNGMVVSCVNTIGSFWGERNTVINGIYLNACLNNFSNLSSSVNSYEPGKKPRSYISPTIIRKGEKDFMAIRNSRRS